MMMMADAIIIWCVRSYYCKIDRDITKELMLNFGFFGFLKSVNPLDIYLSSGHFHVGMGQRTTESGRLRHL